MCVCVCACVMHNSDNSPVVLHSLCVTSYLPHPTHPPGSLRFLVADAIPDGTGAVSWVTSRFTAGSQATSRICGLPIFHAGGGTSLAFRWRQTSGDFIGQPWDFSGPLGHLGHPKNLPKAAMKPWGPWGLQQATSVTSWSSYRAHDLIWSIHYFVSGRSSWLVAFC